MERWKDGKKSINRGFKFVFQHSNIPIFQHSNITLYYPEKPSFNNICIFANLKSQKNLK